MTLVISGVNRVLLYAWTVTKKRSYETIREEVIRLLREEREKRGLSMNIVAQRAGLSQSSLSLLENNKRNPTLDTLLRIGEAIDTDIGAMITKASGRAKT